MLVSILLQIITLTFFAIVIGGIYWQLGTGFLDFQDRYMLYYVCTGCSNAHTHIMTNT